MGLLTIILIVIGVLIGLFVLALWFVGDGDSNDSGEGNVKTGFDKLLSCCGFR